jgi:predicted translin family RNA/ssDNA-binding protein
MVHRDELRENLIKKCRDGQKFAKQAIYALHREDFKKAKKLIDDCEKCVLEQLIPIVKEESQLRYGSFANVLEEYAEAKLFYAWLVGDGDGEDVNVKNAAGKVLLPNDFATIPLEPEEYLGGLADLTGEIGRFAVKKGTLRDTENVKLSLETDMSILYAFESLCKLPGGGVAKKMDQLRRSVEKLEKMLYELSLSQATGRKITAGVNEFESSKD